RYYERVGQDRSCRADEIRETNHQRRLEGWVKVVLGKAQLLAHHYTGPSRGVGGDMSDNALEQLPGKALGAVDSLDLLALPTGPSANFFPLSFNFALIELELGAGGDECCQAHRDGAAQHLRDAGHHHYSRRGKGARDSGSHCEGCDQTVVETEHQVPHPFAAGRMDLLRVMVVFASANRNCHSNPSLGACRSTARWNGFLIDARDRLNSAHVSAPAATSIDPAAQVEKTFHNLARFRAGGFLSQIRVQEREPGGLAQKTADAAIEVNEVAHPMRPGHVAGFAEVFKIEKPHPELPSGSICYDH